ncbi:MAG: hypothetical protein ACO38P_05805, partial [Phycisphaerales bacterium]
MTKSIAETPPVGSAETSLRERIGEVRTRIQDAARRAGRDAREIALIAVTKHASIDLIREAIGLGQVDFGENRVQQLVQRAAQIEEHFSRRRQLPEAAGDPSHPTSVRWHMIGHLQRNKVRKAVELCRLIHGVDSLRVAEEIQAAATRRETPVEVLVQVNVAGEQSKSGVAPA